MIISGASMFWLVHPIVARVAWAGQVLVSQASAGLVAGQLPAGAMLADLGWHRLADLGPAEQVWQLGHPGLPGVFPPLRSLGGYRHNLPVELTSFVPRDAELAELAALVAARMFISRRTVTTHLTSIFRKLGISSRTELAARAARREDQEPPRSRIGAGAQLSETKIAAFG